MLLAAVAALLRPSLSLASITALIACPESASLRVYEREEYPLLDLRVDEHAHPVAELRRVYTIALLQLLPFVEGMPKKGRPATPAPDAVVKMLALSPPYRPGGGGSS